MIDSDTVLKYLKSVTSSAGGTTHSTTSLPKGIAVSGGVAIAIALLALMLLLDPGRFGQTFLNGLTSASIYGIMAIGFTLQYSTVWYFDLSYAAMSTTAAYTILHFHSSSTRDPSLVFSSIIGLLIAVVVIWTLYAWVYPRFRHRLPKRAALSLGTAISVALGIYTGVMFANPEELNVYISPLIGVLTAGAVIALLSGLVYSRVSERKSTVLNSAFVLFTAIVAAVLGVVVGWILSRTPEANLTLSAALGVFVVGCISLVLYRGIFFHLRRRARSPMIMLVASLGVMITLIALVVILFTAQAHDLPDPLGTSPIHMLGGSVKGFRIFMWGAVIAVFGVVSLLVNKTKWGKTVRAISDDEEVAMVVGINTTLVIASVFFLGAAIFGFSGVLMGLDTAIRPTMGFIALLKGWIAATIGGLGNLKGAIVGALFLGMIENFGVWWIASDWKDAVAFIVLILFLLYRPGGLLKSKQGRT